MQHAERNATPAPAKHIVALRQIAEPPSDVPVIASATLNTDD
jgi:hypothetical protein